MYTCIYVDIYMKRVGETGRARKQDRERDQHICKGQQTHIRKKKPVIVS